MNTTILKLNNLTKTFILGNHKSAHKAQKAIQKLHSKFDIALERKHLQEAERLEAQLRKAQLLFADEKFAASFEMAASKHLRSHRRDRGVVVHALNGIDLEIKPGELVAVMGPSGSGKSTLLNMLGLLDEATAGQIFIKDKKVSAIKRRDLPNIRSRELGFVFQSFNLITTLTALENVMLPLRYAGIGLKQRRRMAKKALEQVGLGNRLHHKPNELSGGQQQRVAIARSIVNSPSVIFGDELTGELDSKMTNEIMKLVEELNAKGQTFVIVTHNPEVAERCHRIIYMRDGKIEKEVRK